MFSDQTRHASFSFACSRGFAGFLVQCPVVGRGRPARPSPPESERRLMAGIAAVGHKSSAKRSAGAGCEGRDESVHAPAAQLSGAPIPDGRKRHLKIDGWAFGARSIGATAPLMLQYADSPLAAAVHCGALNVTADTGSPIAVTGMLSPSLAEAQSASVMARAPAGLAP